MFISNPETRRKIGRFKEIKRGYYSFLVLMGILLLTSFCELISNSRALLVSYEGNLYFPTYSAFHPGTDFGLDYPYETNYRELKQKFLKEGSGNWVFMPPVTFNPYENNAEDNIFRPNAPSIDHGHYLGTDTTSRDILSRLIYGTRIALWFALAFTLSVYLIGIVIGCAMGYFGGIFDLLFQRFIEIWSNIPFLYMVIIVFSVVPSGLPSSARITILLSVMVLFSWTSITYYMRTETYREKSRDYVSAARIMGASTWRIIFRHILPNAMSTLITFVPFTVIAAITAITALDFLGFGLPPPTPSLGELLKQGTSSLRTAPWIVISAFGTLVMILTLITFVGEAIRESFDPKKFTIYE